ncbi:MAG: cation diffusion facilitator family transporter [Amaricoccus sp.]
MAEGSTRVVIAALVGNAAIAATKYAAAAATGSSAMFAEAVHSTVDTGNQILLLVGLQRAARPADPRHPFGHGKELYFWAFVVAILLFGIGAGVSIYEGLIKFRDPHPLANVGWNYLVIAIAMVFEAGAWFVAWREFDRERGGRPILATVRQSKDPALFTVLFEDSAAILGLAVALLGVLASDKLGWLRADAVATIAIGGILATAAVLLAIETKSLLIGEGASPALVEDIIGTAGRAPFVEAVNEVRTLHFGPTDVLVNLSVDARDAMTAGEVERGIAALEDEIKARHPEVSRVFIEIQAAKASAEELAEGDTGANH